MSAILSKCVAQLFETKCVKQAYAHCTPNKMNIKKPTDEKKSARSSRTQFKWLEMCSISWVKRNEQYGQFICCLIFCRAHSGQTHDTVNRTSVHTISATVSVITSI